MAGTSGPTARAGEGPAPVALESLAPSEGSGCHRQVRTEAFHIIICGPRHLWLKIQTSLMEKDATIIEESSIPHIYPGNVCTHGMHKMSTHQSGQSSSG